MTVQNTRFDTSEINSEFKFNLNLNLYSNENLLKLKFIHDHKVKLFTSDIKLKLLF